MPSRRQFLAAGCLALAATAGCTQVRDAIATGAAGDETSTREATADESAGATTGGKSSEFRVAVTDSDGGEVVLVTGADVATVGEVEPARTGGAYRLAMTLTDEGTAAFADELERVGALDDTDSHRLRTYFRDELLYEARLGKDLAHAMKTGDWNGEFLFHVTERETAENVRAALKTGDATKTTVESG